MSENWDNVYLKEENAYEWFSQHEDYGNKVVDKLIANDLFKNKKILEIGCGSGRYTQFLAPYCKEYFALDISDPLLKLAKQKCKKLSNITFFRCSAENIPMPDNSVDILFSSWAMIMNPISLRNRVFREANRVVHNGSKIIIVDNYWEGEFMDMRGDYEKRLARANINWIKKRGFITTKIINSNFYFPDKIEAIKNLKYIFGDKVSKYLSKIDSPYLKHKILINYKKVVK